MKVHRHNFGFHLLVALLLGLGGLAPVQAQSVKVQSASPDFAEQGTPSLDVTIRGTGFVNVESIRFFRKGQEPTAKDIEVLEFVDPDGDSTTVTATIKVDDEAVVDGYNIEVSLRNGRKGKGTTRLFSVREKDVVYACGYVFDLPAGATCDCWFRRLEEVSSGTPPGIAWKLTNHCTTDATLVIPWFTRVTGEDAYTITAVTNSDGDFNGPSVIAVEGHRAEFTESHVILSSDIDAGCTSGQLNSVIQFLLDDNSPDPFNDVPDWWDEERWWRWNSYPNTWWEIRGNTIEVPEGMTPPCQLIEAGRVAGEYTYDTAERIAVGGNVTAGPYADAAIWLHHVGPNTQNGPLGAFSNTIGPASGVSADSIAVVVGPFEGEVEVSQNVITLLDGTGIMTFFGSGASGASVHHNDVLGGYRGVVADSSISSLTVNSNTLSGDDSEGSKGVCSEADSDRIRANKISNYGTKVQRSGCF
jgi:hypothetical protein